MAIIIYAFGDVYKKTHVQRHYILGTYNPNLIELILKLVQMYLNIFSYWRYL